VRNQLQTLSVDLLQVSSAAGFFFNVLDAVVFLTLFIGILQLRQVAEEMVD